MTNHQIVEEIGKPILNKINNLAMLSIAGIVSSPLVFIWFTFILSLKVGITSLFLLIIFYKAGEAVRKSIRRQVDQAILELKDENLVKTGFHIRVNELLNK